MCWTSKTEPVRKVADKDIKVIKVMVSGDTPSPSYYNGKLFSPYRMMEYDLNKVYEEKIGDPVKVKPTWPSYLTNVLLEPQPHYQIREGLHSYSADNVQLRTTECDLRFVVPSEEHWRSWKSLDTWPAHGRTVITLGIVPEGSEYYENEYGEIVSNKLQIVKVYARIGELCEEAKGFFVYMVNQFQIPQEAWQQ